jgi:hypothetical protein
MKSPAFRLVLALLLVSAVAREAHAGREQLAARYGALAARLSLDASPVSFAVDTRGGNGEARGDVFGILQHDFASVSAALGTASIWCDIAPLHLNVKSCTYGEERGRTRLTLYSGRKGYERPEDAHVLAYEFRLAEAREGYLRVLLTANEGPLDSSDYVLELEAMPLGASASFIHLGYAYRYGLGMRLALAGYFATRGNGKVGFSVVGTDASGNPIYVGGIDGLIERNAVRYQLAIQAYLDTREAPKLERFERSVARWFDLTEPYRRQLFELEQQEYIRNKRRERSQQLRLQKALASETLQH